MTDDDPALVDCFKTVADLGGSVYSLVVTVRPLRPGERGRASWPRFRMLTEPLRVVVEARAWPGDRAHLVRTLEIVWTFNPITMTVSGSPVSPSRFQHVLDAAGFKWPGGGRKHLEESPSSSWRAYAEQARDLLASGEVRTIREAAERLMVDYDSLGDDSIAERKAIRAAEVRLGGYLKRLRELGG